MFHTEMTSFLDDPYASYANMKLLSPMNEFNGFTPDLRFRPERPLEQPQDQIVQPWPAQFLGLSPLGRCSAEQKSLGFQNSGQVVDCLFGGLCS